MRTTAEECTALGSRLADRVRASRGPVSVVLPLAGVSALSVAGQPFHDPRADQALFVAIREGCGTSVELIELDCEINHPRFARTLAERVLALRAAVHSLLQPEAPVSPGLLAVLDARQPPLLTDGPPHRAQSAILAFAKQIERLT